MEQVCSASSERQVKAAKSIRQRKQRSEKRAEDVYKRQSKDLLMNPVYTGAIASQKKDYRFKIGTIGEKKPEDWIVVEGQHEPLIVGGYSNFLFLNREGLPKVAGNYEGMVRGPRPARKLPANVQHPKFFVPAFPPKKAQKKKGERLCSWMLWA